MTALGDRHGGWAFYLLEGRPVATFALLDGPVRVAADAPVPPGAHVLGCATSPAPALAWSLSVDGADVAEAPLRGWCSSRTSRLPGPACSWAGTAGSR